MPPSKDPVPTLEACQAAVKLLTVAAKLPELVERAPDKLGTDFSAAYYQWLRTQRSIKDAEAKEKAKEKLQAEKAAEAAKHSVPLVAMEKRAETAELSLGQAVLKQAQTEQDLADVRKEMEEMRKEMLKRKAADAGEGEGSTAPVDNVKKKR